MENITGFSKPAELRPKSRLPVRHELKFQLNYGDYLVLSRLLDTMLTRDPNGDALNEYRIRSLYFDTAFDDALYEKLSGIENREKIRIRIYNNSDKTIKLESKRKFGDLTHKDSLTIPRKLADQLIARDTSGLLQTNEPLLHRMYSYLTTKQLRPAVIVDYVREAYLHPADDVRITFDKQLRTGLRSIDMFNAYIPTIDPFDDPTVILEVKYNLTLPPHIASVMNSLSAVRQSFSKYVICRKFEGYPL